MWSRIKVDVTHTDLSCWIWCVRPGMMVPNIPDSAQ
jgi:hypothetical protein